MADSILLWMPSLAFAVLRRSPQVQESPLEHWIRSFLAAQSAQELHSPVYVVFWLSIFSAAFPASNSYTALSSTLFGKSRGAGVLGGRMCACCGEAWEGSTQTEKGISTSSTSE